MISGLFLFVLSITLRVLSLTLKATVVATNVVTKGTPDEDSTVKKFLVKALKILSRILDTISSLLVSAWVFIVTFVLVMVLSIATLFLVLDLENSITVVPTLTNTSAPRGTQGEYKANGPIPPVAANTSQIRAAMLANIDYAMANRGTGYVYSQTDPGNPQAYDCSGWVSAALAMAGWRIDDNGNLVERPGDRYIFAKNSLSDLVATQDRWATYSMNSSWQKYAIPFTGDASQLEPGDILLENGHVAIYHGEGILSHASLPGATVSSSKELKRDASDVGFAPLYTDFHTIIRFK